MKKLKSKLTRKKAQTDSKQVSRITNETIAEHRERILAGGRKFKYPHQYVRHKLVINAAIIAVLVLIGSAILIWQQLYIAQNTTDFMYRISRVAPVPVGNVDGEQIRYSDYLMRYRSQELWLQTKGQVNLTGEDGKRQIDFIKRNVFDGLAVDVYAEKKARDANITVSEAEIDSVIDSNRETKTGKISQEVYYASTRETLGFSPSEYRHLVKQSLLRQKVAYELDEDAAQLKDRVSVAVKADEKANFEQLVGTIKGDDDNVVYGASGLVPVDNQDGGLSKVAAGLEDEKISDAVKSTTGDGYYFIRRISGNDRQISYEYIHVPLTVFNDEFKKLKDEQKISEYINIPEATAAERRE